MLNRWCRVLIGACVLSLTPTACDAILGGDFKVVPATTAGGTGPGGDGGGGAGNDGGSGGTDAPRAPFVCAWRPDSQRIVGSLEAGTGESRRWDPKIRAVRLDDSLRAMLWREGVYPEPSMVDMYLVHSGGAAHGTFEAANLHEVKRIDNGRVGALTTVQPQGTGGAAGGGPLSRELHLHVVLDSDAEGSSATDLQLTAQGSFDDSAEHPDLRAAFAPVGNGDGSAIGDVPFFARYVGSDFRYRGVFGYYEGSPLAPVPVTEPGADLPDDQVQPGCMVHHEGTSYVITGEGEGESAGIFEYVLQPDTSGPVVPRAFEPATLMPGDLRRYGDHGNLALADVGTDPLLVRILVMQMPLSTLGSFDVADLDAVHQWSSLSDVPFNVAEGAFIRWSGDTLIVGGPPPQGAEELVLLFIGDRADARGEVHLPLDVEIEPGGDRSIRAAFAASQFEDGFEAIGGELHVLWLEEHETPSQPDPYSVLYYGLADCEPAVR